MQDTMPATATVCRIFADRPGDRISIGQLYDDLLGDAKGGAAGIRSGDAMAMCAHVFTTSFNQITDMDADWCGQYTRYVPYHSLDPSDTVIADSAGHMPDRAAGIEPGRAHSECLGPVQDADAEWCAEFVPLYAFSLCHGIHTGCPSSGERRSGEAGTCAEYARQQETDGA